MNDITSAFQRLEISTTLKHDLSIIFESWILRQERLDLDQLIIQPGEFPSTRSLYEHLMSILSSTQNRGSLMEIMPYIDDYLEYYESITASF